MLQVWDSEIAGTDLLLCSKALGPEVLDASPVPCQAAPKLKVSGGMTGHANGHVDERSVCLYRTKVNMSSKREAFPKRTEEVLT